MSLTANILLADIGPTHPIGQRLREWLQPFSEKLLLRRFPGVALVTIRRWRQGNMPQSQHLAAMVAEFGVDFLEYLFAPVLAETDASFERRLERLELSAAALKREFRDHGGEKIGSDVAVAVSHSGATARQCRGVASGAGQGLARAGKGLARRSVSVLCLLGVLAQAWDAGDDWARLAKSPRIQAPISRLIKSAKKGGA